MTGVTLDPAAVGDLLIRAGGKGVLLLAAVGVLALALRRASAAARHLVWFLGVGALLALPVLEVVVPSWSVPLPSPSSPEVGGAADAPGREAGARAPRRAELPAGRAPGVEAVVASSLPATPPGQASGPSRGRSGAAAGPAIGASPAAGEGAGAEGGAADRRAGAAWRVWVEPLFLIGLVWAAGTLLLLLALGRSVGAARRLAREAEPFSDGRVRRLAGELATDLGIRRPVRLLRGGPGVMPMSFGLARPTVFLPEGAARWSRSRLLAVLLHELAHVRRRDVLTQALAEVARALHWPNPLVWLAVRRLRVEREHACDDRVLEAGARPSEYASELLALVRGFRKAPGTPSAAVAMARPGDFRLRLRAVLADRRPRHLSRPGAACAVVAVVGLAVPLAAFTPAPEAARVGARNAPSLPGHPSTPGDSGIPFSSARTPQETTCGMAPTGWEGTSHSVSDGRHRLEWRREGCQVEVRVEGDVEFGPDFRSVQRLGSGGLLRIQEEEGSTERRLEVTPGPDGSPRYAYRVDGRERAFDASAEAWFRGMLLQVFRRGGFMAGERVQALLERGGVDAVLRELELLEADHVFARYTEELMSRADLDEDRMVDLIGRARTRIDSDHYLARILEAAWTGSVLTDRVLDATLDASRDLESDHYRAQVLERALERNDLDVEEVRLLLASASEMESDHYLAGVLTGVAERYVPTPALRSAYLRTVSSLESDHYRAQVLSSLLARDDLDEGELAEVLRAAGRIESDHYLAGILTEVAGRGLSGGPLRDAYFEVARSVASDHYRQGVLMPLVRDDALEPALLVRVLEAVSRMESDHYKAEVLVEIARRQPLRGETRNAFLDALDGIGSSHYRGVVSEALLRAEGRRDRAA